MNEIIAKSINVPIGGNNWKIPLVSQQDLEQQTETIIQAIVANAGGGVSDSNLSMNSDLFVGLGATKNTNFLNYYQVKAQMIDDELQVTVTNRDGSVLGSAISAYGTLSLIFTVGIRNYPNHNPPIGTILSFNDNNNANYLVSSNGIVSGNTDVSLSNPPILEYVGVMAIDIAANPGTSDEIVLGEIEFGITGTNDTYGGSSNPVVIFSTPIPKN